MTGAIKSGAEVVREFFAEIYNVEDAEKSVADMLVKLYDDDKLTDTNIKNALDELLKKELMSDVGKNE
jgi:hypothetical protein